VPISLRAFWSKLNWLALIMFLPELVPPHPEVATGISSNTQDERARPHCTCLMLYSHKVWFPIVVSREE